MYTFACTNIVALSITVVLQKQYWMVYLYMVQ